MRLYPLAAQCEWNLALFDSANAKAHIRAFLDMMDKAGCPNVAFFRGQFNLSDATKEPVPAKPVAPTSGEKD